MDLTKLSDVADRKRIKTDVENLKAKISRENEKIIKLKVGQDTAYWELKEKLSCTQRDHETLQRNMVQLQMEHESVSAQYQDELRRRPETLNKLVSTREICDVLEDNVGRVRASLQRSAADRAALADAYARAGAAVAAAHTENEKRLLAATNEARSARDLARLSGEHGAQLMEYVSRERSRADQAVADAERIREQRDTVAEHLSRRDTLLQERDKTIQELRNEQRRAADEFNEWNERSKNTIAGLEREAGAAATLRAALSQAEARCEAASRDVSRLATELAATTAAKDDAQQLVATLNLQIQENQLHINKMKEAMNFLVQNSEDLAKQIKDKDEKIRSMGEIAANSQQEAQTLTERIAIIVEERERERRDYEERETELDCERGDFEKRLAAAEHDISERADTIEKLMRDIADIEKAKAHAEATIAEQANQLERERGDNEKRTVATEIELAEYTNTIALLKQDITVEKEARARADAALAELTAKHEHEIRDHEERVANTKCELAERDDTIANLRRDLAVETEARACADSAMAEQVSERERDRRDFEKRLALAERDSIERNNTIAHLKRDLAVESDARARSEATLTALCSELNTAREEVARALDDVHNLKADVRRKDDEAAKQMQIILSIRGEKEQMQDKMNEMQETINNIQEITRKTPPALAVINREPPEHDDNAVAAPPTPFRAIPQPPSATQRSMTPTPHRKRTQPRAIDTIYNLFSDNSDSMDQDTVDPVEVSRRYEALSRADPLSPPPTFPLNALKRRHARKRVPPAPAGPVSMPAPPSVRAPQAAARAADGTRKFFKTRRFERDERQKK